MIPERATRSIFFCSIFLVPFTLYFQSYALAQGTTTQSSACYGYGTFSLVGEVGEQSDEMVEEAQRLGKKDCEERVKDGVAEANAAAENARNACKAIPGCTATTEYTSSNLDCSISADKCIKMLNGVTCNFDASYSAKTTCRCGPNTLASETIEVPLSLWEALEPALDRYLAESKAGEGEFMRPEPAAPDLFPLRTGPAGQ